MNWDVYAFWNYHHWTSMAFVVVIVVEMVIAMLYGKGLFFSKPKVTNKIHGVDTERQKVGSPIRPLGIRRNNCPNTENNTETNP